MRHILREAKNYTFYLLRNLSGLVKKLEHDFSHHDKRKPVVVYVPGFSVSPHALGPAVKRRLEAIGCKAFIFDAGINVKDVRETSAQLQLFIEEICQRCQVDEVSIVAHSMGGLIARYYLQRLGGYHRINKIIALATPFNGTLMAYLALPTKAARQILPGSAFLRHLAHNHEYLDRIISIRASKDQIIKPKASSILVGTRNIEVKVVGHVTIMEADQVWNIIKKELI